MPELINVHATVKYPDFDYDNFCFHPFSIPTYGGKYYRGATDWEKECLETANTFLEKLFDIPSFVSTFKKNRCCMKKEEITHFLTSQGYDIFFPDSREYREPFSWDWCQLDAKDHHGCIKDNGSWLFATVAAPTIHICVFEKDVQPFSRGSNCVSVGDIDVLAQPICQASKYNVPYLYSLAEDVSDYARFEYGNCLEDYPGLVEVLEFMDREILPVFNVIVDTDTVRCNAGEYQMHILEPDELRRLIKMHKKQIKEIIEKV